MEWLLYGTVSNGEIDNNSFKTDGSEEVRRIAHTYNQYYSPDCDGDIWSENYWEKC